MVAKTKSKFSKKRSYFNSKEKVLAFLKKKVECECGCYVSKKSINSHKLTKKHHSLLVKNKHPISNA